jgi:hypothetical protein
MAAEDAASERRSKFWGYVIVALWGATFLIARAALDKDLKLEPAWLRVLIALMPVVPTALFLWLIVSSLGGMDELHRRVHLEALAIAYPLAILMLVTLGFLQLAVDLSPEDWSYRHVWAYLPVFYLLGLTVAWRRYR